MVKLKNIIVTDVTLDNLEQVLQSSASLYTTVVPWFGKEYEQPVSICVDDVSGQVYYRFLNGWARYPIERKKNSKYIYINGQVLYIN